MPQKTQNKKNQEKSNFCMVALSHNITFICTPTNQETSVLEKTQANKTLRTQLKANVKSKQQQLQLNLINTVTM